MLGCAAIAAASVGCGERLSQLVSDDQFWFALAAIFPQAEVRRES